jgi:hypothetical protein
MPGSSGRAGHASPLRLLPLVDLRAGKGKMKVMIDDDLKGLFQEMRQSITAIQQEMTVANQKTAAIQQEIAAVRQENAVAHAETRRHFEVVAERSEHKIALLAESVIQTREFLNREATDIREEVRRTASETQAMIKFSHAELDRRMRTLEDAV